MPDHQIITDPQVIARLTLFGRIDRFLLDQRDRVKVDVHVWATLLMGITAWRRYYNFLEIILKRFDMAIEALREAKGDPDRHELLHLEIESFYLFSKNLLDKAAECLVRYFDYKWHKKPYGSTHVQLVKEFGRLLTTKHLVESPHDIRALIHDTKRRIVEYRNDPIEHPRELLSYGTTYQANGEISLLPFIVGPTGRRSKASEDPHALMILIVDYLVAWFAFLEANYAKSVLALTPRRGD